MFCRNCGAQVADGATFCPSCGASLAVRGPQDQGAAPEYQQQNAQQGYPQQGYPQQGYPQQGYPQRPAYQPPKSNPCGIISLIFGIIGAFFGVIAMFYGIGIFAISRYSGGWVIGGGAFVLAIIPLVLGIVSVALAGKSRNSVGRNGLATAGTVLGVIAIITSCLGLVMMIIGKVTAPRYDNYLDNIFNDIDLGELGDLFDF